MANVKCTICGQSFDRTKEEYAKTSSNRYAHAACALRAVAAGKKFKIPIEVIDPFDEVECKICHKKMSKSKDPDCVSLGAGEYACRPCAELESKREKTDKEKLEDYIKQLFKTDYVPPRVQKQITEFVQKYNFSYSGLQRTLFYFYEIKKNDISKANGGITICKFVYQEAYNYFYHLWEIEQRNAPKIAVLDKQYVPQIVEITAKYPEAKKKQSQFFNFLDEDAAQQ